MALGTPASGKMIIRLSCTTAGRPPAAGYSEWLFCTRKLPPRSAKTEKDPELVWPGTPTPWTGGQYPIKKSQSAQAFFGVAWEKADWERAEMANANRVSDIQRVFIR